MKPTTRHIILAVAMLASMAPSISRAQMATIHGRVVDTGTGQPLAGANVAITIPGEAVPVTGSSTDFDGEFVIERLAAGSYDLVVRYIGFEEWKMPVSLSSGQYLAQPVALSVASLTFASIVVTASRREEKVLDAPASITVLPASEIEEEATASTVAAQAWCSSSMRRQTGISSPKTSCEPLRHSKSTVWNSLSSRSR